MNDSNAFRRARTYARTRELALARRKLGHGSDGIVYLTTHDTALKVSYIQRTFATELECYQRLSRKNVQLVGVFNVPLLMDFDIELMAMELLVVKPPYLLDFGKVALDIDPVHHYGTQVLRQQAAHWQSLFGSDWPQVSEALYELQTRFGIYYLDPRPGNIDTGRDELEMDDDWLREPPIDYDNYS